MKICRIIIIENDFMLSHASAAKIVHVHGVAKIKFSKSICTFFIEVL